MKSILISMSITLIVTNILLVGSETSLPLPPETSTPPSKTSLQPDYSSATIFNISKQVCFGCIGESLQFLFAHNLVRAAKWELPLMWDFQLQRYATRWADQRRPDCKLQHSFPEDGFKLGENIYWGSGSQWTPSDAVRAWAEEEKYYNYQANTCEVGQMCGHYTQIVWRTTARIGCARVVCDDGDVFMTCNYDPPGLVIVGYTAVVLGIVSLSPFLLLTLISIPKIDSSRWVNLGEKGVEKDWALFFNTLFWNLNFWDSASTLAGEVDRPQKTFPKALGSAGLLTCLGYLIPLLAATGAVSLNQQKWSDGYLADVAEIVAGKWLKYWMEIGACLSVIGLYEAQLSGCAYQVLGMTDLGFLPSFFGIRSRWFNTRWVGILISTVIALSGSCMDFADIISSVNFFLQ